MVDSTNPTQKRQLKDGDRITDEEFKNHVPDADTIEEIDFTKWTADDCIVTDLTLPAGNEGKFARTVENILTEDECKAMI